MNRWQRMSAIGAALVLTIGTPVTAFAASGDLASYQDVNDAVAINTEDGASLFRLAFAVRTVADGVVDQENLALAYASCTDCQTVALAFELLLVMGDTDIVVPVNQAVAYNDQCQECLTFASATQIVVGVGGPVRLTGEGRRRLLELRQRLLALEEQIGQMTPSQLVTAVSAVEAELIALLSTELVPVGQEANPEPPTPSTSTTGLATSTTAVTSTTTRASTTPTPSSTTTATSSTSAPETTAPDSTLPTTASTTVAPTTTATSSTAVTS